MNSDFLLSSYMFSLPPELIAQEPAPVRDGSRLMILDRASGALSLSRFADLAAHLPPGLFVINNSRVLPARLTGQRASGGKAEFLLLTPLPLLTVRETGNGWQEAEAEGLLRDSKRLRTGEEITLGESFSLVILEKADFGRSRVRLRWKGILEERFRNLGALPLPPYIRRPAGEADAERYQTLFARSEKTGSVAAPTAGLHFSEGLKEALTAAGHTWAEITLYVGYGTFSPVRCHDIRDHGMHAEFVEISPETAEAVNRAKAEGRAVTAVGTTAVRALEGVWRSRGRVEGHAGWINIFLYPGEPFGVVDHLITNFHLPGSTLLMLVSAFAGRERMLDAYARAVQERFRFFSYGDAMLIL